jgi:hypothetical protein
MYRTHPVKHGVSSLPLAVPIFRQLEPRELSAISIQDFVDPFYGMIGQSREQIGKPGLVIDVVECTAEPKDAWQRSVLARIKSGRRCTAEFLASSGPLGVIFNRGNHAWQAG